MENSYNRRIYGYISTTNDFPNPSVILHLQSLEPVGKENILLTSPDEVMAMAQERKATEIMFYFSGQPRRSVDVKKAGRHLKKLFAS